MIVCLLVQWTEIYQIFRNPARAADNAANKFYERLLTGTVGILSLLILSDLLSIWSNSKAYDTTMTVLLTLFNISVLTSFTILYILFIRLIREDALHFLTMTRQVHVFFVFMLVWQLTRVIATDTESFKYYGKKNTTVTQIVKLEYFNIGTECLFNLFILYYFVRVWEKNKTEIDDRR